MLENNGPALIKPVEFTVSDGDGNEKTFILSNFNAIDGREIISQYPITALPEKFGGNFTANKEIYLKLMNHVAVIVHGQTLRLSTADLINNHVTDWEMSAKIEMAMMEKNASFFRDGRSWDFLENIAQAFQTKLSEILMNVSAPSSPLAKQPSTNSEPSTM